MSHFIADAIHEHLASQAALADVSSQMCSALLAVLDECERLRATNSVLGHALGFEFEGVVVRELNVAFPIDQVDEVKRLLGH